MRRAGLVILSAALAVRASADTGSADLAVGEAKTRAAKNDFVGAAAKYREAYKADPRPELMCNVGVAYYKAKDLPRAQRYLDQCLSTGSSLERAFIDNVKKVLAAVETTLAAGNFTPVDLLVQPPTATTSVEGGVVFDEPIVGSRRVWFPFGTYKLTVHAEGHVDRVIEIAAKDRTQIATRVALEDAPVPAVTSREQPAQPEHPPQGSGAEPAPPPSSPTPPPVHVAPSRSVVAPLLATGASLALGGVAIGYFLGARSSAEDAGNATDRMRYDELRDQAYSRQHMSWLFGGVAGAGAIVSAVLWYRYATPPRVEVQATGSSIAISGRW